MGTQDFIIEEVRTSSRPTREPVAYCVPDLPAIDEILPYLREVAENRWYSNFGPLHDRFLEELASTYFASQPEVVHLTLTSSGTTALDVLIRCLDLPTGSEIGVPALTFPATAIAIMNAGHVPVVLDVSPDSWMLEPDEVLKCSRIHSMRAVIPVATFGLPINLEKWHAFQEKTGIKVVVDAAAALGSQKIIKNIPVAFSLHATKPFGVGEGGVIASMDQELILRARRLVNFGFEDGLVKEAGFNAKLSEYHCSVGIAQTRRATLIRHRRAKAMTAYRSYLRSISEHVCLQPKLGNVSPASLVVCIKGGQVANLKAFLKKKGIETRALYLPTLDEHPFIRNGIAHVLTNYDLKGRLYSKLLALPFHSFLSEPDVMLVSESIAEYYKYDISDKTYQGRAYV